METVTAYIISGLSVLITALVSSRFTSRGTNTSWYDEIKPSFTPPDKVFPVVWTVLYLLFVVAFARILSGGAPDEVVVLAAANLLLNVVWCGLFFSARQILLGLIAIGVLWCTTLGMLLLTRDALARICILPYFAWITFAAALNIGSLVKWSRRKDTTAASK